MVDRGKIHHSLKNIQRIKTWQLIIVFILACFVSATFLRLNNIGMVERRDAVLTADSAGDDSVTKARLYELQQYVTSHMNTNMGKGVYLEYSYNRDYDKLLEAASSDGITYGNIYKAAQEVCAPQFSSYSSAYVNCTLSEIEKYPSSSNLVDSVSLSTSLYVHNFTSPTWSPDFAGWSVVVCVVILIMILLRLISSVILRLLLKRRFLTI